MNITIHEVEQRTEAWAALRRGRVTGSCALDVSKERQRGKGELEGRAKLRRRIVAELMTLNYAHDAVPYLPHAMQRGVDREPDALAAYEARTATLVTPVGFISHNELMVGCSPDGVIGSIEGGIELKCPNPDTHLEYWQSGGVPEEYKPQVIHNLWVTGASWWDFVSWDDRFTDPVMQLYVFRVERASVDVAGYESKVLAFLAEVDRDYQIALGRQWQRPAEAVA